MTEPEAGSQRLLSRLNVRAVLEIVDRLGPVARPELARQAGISRTAITRILSGLLELGIVTRTGTDRDRRGPSAGLYSVDPCFRFGAAVDIGHRTTSAAIVDLSGQLLARKEQPSATESVEEVTALVVELLDKAASELGLDFSRLDRVVVGVPAVVDAEEPEVMNAHYGSLRLASGLPEPSRALPELLRRALPMPVQLENDTNLAAIAESHSRTGSSTQSFALLRLGGSVGVGIVIDRVLHRGHHASAGVVPETGAPFSGSTNAADVLGTASVAADAASEGLPPGLTAHEIFDLARAGDTAALKVAERTGRRLGPIATAIAILLDPELIILGGGIGANHDLLAPPITEYLRAHAPASHTEIVETVAGGDPVLLGAATLCAQHIRETAFESASRMPRARP